MLEAWENFLSSVLFLGMMKYLIELNGCQPLQIDITLNQYCIIFFEIFVFTFE